MAKKEKIVTDPFGSYTGLVRHPEESRCRTRTICRTKAAAGKPTA